MQYLVKLMRNSNKFSLEEIDELIKESENIVNDNVDTHKVMLAFVNLGSVIFISMSEIKNLNN